MRKYLIAVAMMAALAMPASAQLNSQHEAAPVSWTVVGLGDYGSACIISS